MADKVDVQLSHHYGDNVPGDRITVDAGEAKRLVSAGIARYATKPAARKAGGDPEDAVTAD